MLRHPSIATKRYCSTPRMQTPKPWIACVPAALTEMDWSLPNQRSASAATTVSRDKCERSYKLATLAVERFGHLGKESNDLIDQLAARNVGGTDGTSSARRGVCK